ncbi:MAG: DUF3267 domain-containing protein [Clostridia bacterium]|nr:DUF3267 domain-containing protein [Clostridia bacterium]
MKHYELELPQGYKEAQVIDAKDTKFGVIMNLVALAVMVLAVTIGCLILKPTWEQLEQDVTSKGFIWHMLIFLLAMVVYIVLHELVHGAAYKLLTKQKLTFGLTLTVAYCGVPNIYVYRKAALISLLAPFVVFLPVFTALIFVVSLTFDKLLACYMLGMHIGGCSGDLYDTILYLFKYKSPKTLMRDTGPKQTFYVPIDEQ